MKKTLSILLSVIMLLSVFPVLSITTVSAFGSNQYTMKVGETKMIHVDLIDTENTAVVADSCRWTSSEPFNVEITSQNGSSYCTVKANKPTVSSKGALLHCTYSYYMYNPIDNTILRKASAAADCYVVVEDSGSVTPKPTTPTPKPTTPKDEVGLDIQYITDFSKMDFATNTLTLNKGESAWVTAFSYPEGTLTDFSWSASSNLTIKSKDPTSGSTFSRMQFYAARTGSGLISCSTKLGGYDYMNVVVVEPVGSSRYEYKVLSDGTAEITKYNGSDGTLEIPSELDGHTVTSIGNAAFKECTSLKNVTIPDSVTSINDSAFSDCKSLASITMPDSVTSIGDWAFYRTNITSITIPDGITSIGISTFCGCTSLTSVTIPDSVTDIGSYAFMSCKSLTSVAIPDSVTIIGYDAFGNCTSLTSITIPNSVTRIGYNAFRDCTSLTNVTIPDSVTRIDDYAFSDCTSLTSVTIPDSVTDIGIYAFGYIWDNSIRNYVKNNDFTIYGFTGTAAENYANENGFTLVNLDNCQHLQTKETIITQPNCTQSGLAKRICTVCGKTVEDNIVLPATGHSYLTVVIEPTPFEKGYTLHICTQCGYKYKDNYVDAISGLGNVDGDKEITVKDATEIQKYLVGLTTLTDAQKAVADTNGDGDINIKDVTKIQKHLVGLVPSLG